jgi:hypothetical protein
VIAPALVLNALKQQTVCLFPTNPTPEVRRSWTNKSSNCRRMLGVFLFVAAEGMTLCGQRIPLRTDRRIPRHVDQLLTLSALVIIFTTVCNVKSICSLPIQCRLRVSYNERVVLQ